MAHFLDGDYMTVLNRARSWKMGTNLNLYRAALTLLGCCGFAGCQALDSLSSVGSAKLDSLQEEIEKQATVDTEGGWWRKDPGVVLKEIPIGTPVDQARAFMEGHGFKCSEQHAEQGDAYLLCR